MKYYLEIDGKIEEDITQEEMGRKLEFIKSAMENMNFKHLRATLKENSVYDSFGNLWE